MPKGTVKEFAQEKGFGTLEMEDGSIVRFDASVATTFDISPGDVAEVEFREIRGRKIISRVDFGDSKE